MGHAAVASRLVPKPPRKPVKGEPMRLHVILPGDLVDVVDKYAEKLSKEHPFDAKKTRTDALRLLVIDGARHRGLIK